MRSARRGSVVSYECDNACCRSNEYFGWNHKEALPPLFFGVFSLVFPLRVLPEVSLCMLLWERQGVLICAWIHIIVLEEEDKWGGGGWWCARRGEVGAVMVKYRVSGRGMGGKPQLISMCSTCPIRRARCNPPRLTPPWASVSYWNLLGPWWSYFTCENNSRNVTGWKKHPELLASSWPLQPLTSDPDSMHCAQVQPGGLGSVCTGI